jgi:glycosyltransferase involved in cell wall biosynthesis
MQTTGTLTALFAIPGDLHTPTGGYAYARRLIGAAPQAGMRLRVVALPGDFPQPGAASITAAAEALAACDPHLPLLVDGLAFGALPAVALAGVKAPLAVLLHHPLGLETGLDTAQAEHLLRTERAALPHARAIIVTSAATKADAVAHLGADPARITVAPPGLDRPAVGHSTVPKDTPLLLSVGSLTPRKGHDVLIAALARLADRPWRAVIAGAADRNAGWAETLEAQAEAAGLAGRLHFAGALDTAALAALYAEADLFCLPSRHEGYGMVFAEAMAHGLPVIAADIAAAREVIPPGAGLRVPKDDPAALADALAHLLDAPEAAQRMGEAGRTHAAALPGWPDTAATVAQVLRGILP